MFVKVTKSKNFQYVQLVESFRSQGGVKHRVIANLGKLDILLHNEQLIKIAKKFLQLSGQKCFTPQDIKENSRIKYGHIVYKALWEKINIKDIIQYLSKRTKLSFNLNDTIFYLVVNRLLEASSKKKAFEVRDKYYQLNSNLKLQHIYRSLDFLSDFKDEIEIYLFEKQKDLFHLQLDVVFYDVTTFHYESQKSDQLRDFGFSKANKINEVQVVMGLLVNREGRPIGFELFEGNMSEGKTIVSALSKLGSRFKLNKVILVADKAMFSFKNLHLIKESGFEYIVSSKIKNGSKNIQEQVFSDQGYKHEFDQETGEVIYSYKGIANEFIYQDKEKDSKNSYQDRILISWSCQRANNDRKKRQRLLERAEKRIKQGDKNLTQKKGSARYLKTDHISRITAVDYDRIEQDEKWDGYYAVQYSGRELSHHQVMEQYHQLWKIEESFRIMKTTMRTRPIFHWTPKRVHGHFVLCFIAFLLERSLEIKLKNNNIILSPERIKESLNSLQLSEIEIDDQKYYLKSKNKAEANKILRAFKIQTFNNITPIK